MKEICKITELNSLSMDTLVLLDDELGGISLGIKSNKNFKNVEFKFKKMNLNNLWYGVILLKIDESFYTCSIPLYQLKGRFYLEKLLNLDVLNLIIFNYETKENKIYQIINDLKYKILFYLPDSLNYNITIENFDNKPSIEMLWNN